MILREAAASHPILATFGLILLVYLTCLGGVLAARTAWSGRPAYWLAVLGAFFFLVGALWGQGYLSGGATFTALTGGVALAIFAVALDLMFGPPLGPTEELPPPRPSVASGGGRSGARENTTPRER